MFQGEALRFNFSTAYFFNLPAVLSDLGVIIYFYILYSWLIPKYLLKKKYTAYFTLYLLVTLVFIPQQIWCWHGLEKFLFIPPLIQFGGVSFAISIDTFTSLGLRLYEHWSKSQHRRFLLQKEIKEAEILYLKSQMSPHFLFNTLNNIYGLSLNESSETSIAVAQLKSMMNYVKLVDEQISVNLNEEIKYLKNYIALNKLRYNVNITFDNENINPSTIIEPMLLQPFIENAFKHGDTQKDKSINIILIGEENSIRFDITNQFDANKRKDNIGGIGIQNIKKRLDIYYPNKHKLEISQEEMSYRVSLTIDTLKTHKHEN